MSNYESSKSALELVDDRRRGFLGKLLAGGAAAATLPMLSTVAFGEEQGQAGGKGKGGKGKGGKGGKGKGGPQGQAGAAGGQRDPKEMAARMIKEHDKDGDGALNAIELEAALKAMQKRRETMGNGAPGGGAGKGKGGAGKGKGGKGKGGSTAPGGGVKPKKPGN